MLDAGQKYLEGLCRTLIVDIRRLGARLIRAFSQHYSHPAICIILTFLITHLIVYAAFAQETNPGTSCTLAETNHVKKTGGPETGGVVHLMRCDGTTWNQYLTFLSSGNLGRGTEAPATSLDVAGEVQFSSSGLTCGSAQEGAVRYTGGAAPYEFCDGSSWVGFTQPLCQDDATQECYLDSTRANNDPEFLPENIADGVSILGITGTNVGGNTTPPKNCPSIGDTCDDGSIYAGLTPDGNVKMYTTTTDVGQIAWNDTSSNYTDMAMENCTDETPGTAASCQTGEANTAFLVGATGEPDYPFSAAISCDDLEAHGHDDWYLPAQDELNVLYVNKDTGALNGTFVDGGGPSSVYWSSSEASDSSVRRISFSNGGQFTTFKFNALYVRCVRR